MACAAGLLCAVTFVCCSAAAPIAHSVLLPCCGGVPTLPAPRRGEAGGRGTACSQFLGCKGTGTEWYRARGTPWHVATVPTSKFLTPVLRANPRQRACIGHRGDDAGPTRCPYSEFPIRKARGERGSGTVGSGRPGPLLFRLTPQARCRWQCLARLRDCVWGAEERRAGAGLSFSRQPRRPAGATPLSPLRSGLPLVYEAAQGRPSRAGGVAISVRRGWHPPRRVGCTWVAIAK